MGITSMVRTLAMSVGPSITGLLSGNGTFWVAFLATGICRICYDLGLWVLFVNVKVDKDDGSEDDAESVNEDSWDGLLSDTETEGSSEGRESKEMERSQNQV